MQLVPGFSPFRHSLLVRIAILLWLLLLAACGQGTPGVKQSANANLVDLEVRNAQGTWYFDREFDRDVTSYRLTVDSSQGELVLAAIVEDLDATVEINGQPSAANRTFQITLAYGQNDPINIVVTAPDGVTTRTYTLHVLRPDNTTARLLSLDLGGAPLTPVFHPDVYSYEATVPYGQTSQSVTFTTDPQSRVTVDGVLVEAGKSSNSKTLAVGDNFFLINVVAQDGVTNQAYHLKVIRESSKALAQNDRLANLEVEGFSLKPAFSANNTTYTLTVENLVASLTIKPLAQNDAAVVTVNGTAVPAGQALSVPLQLGTHDIIVHVVSADGQFQRDYILSYTRKQRTETRLQRLTLNVDGKEMAYGFKSDKYQYDLLKVPHDVTSVSLTPEAVDSEALVAVDGSLVLRGESGSVSLPQPEVIYPIDVVVTAQDRATSATYQLNVVRVPQTDVTLANLALPTELGFVFDAQTTDYSLSLPYSSASLRVTPTASSAASKVKVNGELVSSGQESPHLPLQVGQNLIEITVIDEYGFNSKSYFIHVERAGSDKAELSILSLSLPESGLNFQAGKLSYDVAVPHSYAQLLVSALAVESATVVVKDGRGTEIAEGSGGWTVPLAVGLNVVTLTVTSQNQANSRVYTLNLTRTGSDNTNLAALIPSFGPVEPAFNAAQTEYTAAVANSIEQFSLQAQTEHPQATVQLVADGVSYAQGSNIPLVSGVAKAVEIIVTAEDGSTKKVYRLTVTRELSNNALLKSLSAEGKVFEPAFAPDVFAYTLKVAHDDATLRVTAASQSPGAELYVNGSLTTSGSASAPVNLQVGNNSIQVLVKSEDGLNSQRYALQVARSGSTDIVELQSSQGALNYDGNAGFNLTVDNSVDSLWLQPTLKDVSASMLLGFERVNNAEQSTLQALVVGENTIAFQVETWDGQVQPYTARITRAKSNNAKLSALGLSSGALIPSFSQDIYSYEVTVNAGVEQVTVSPVTADVGASYTLWVNGMQQAANQINLPVGSTSVEVRVTAADGKATRSYTVTLTRLPSANNLLSDLQLSDNVILSGFDPNIGSYTVNVDNLLSSISLKPFADHPAATIEVEGVVVSSGQTSSALPLLVGANTINVKVTAQNLSVREYTLTVNRAKSNDADLLSLSLNAGNISPSFNPDQFNYAATVGNPVSLLKVSPVASNAQAQITVNGQSVSSGLYSQDLALSVGSNNLINIVVTAESGTQQTYTLTVTRLQSSNANLADLLSPEGSFSRAGSAFTMNVGNDVDTVRLTPSMEHQAAVVYVNGETLSSGQTSLPLALNVGTNVFYLTAQAQDGTQKSYSAAVTRALSSNANLLSLIASSGSLSPVFSPAVLDYTLTVNHEVNQLTLTPTVADSGAWVKIDGVEVVSGAPSQTLGLAVGDNRFAVLVTAQDGSTQPYNVNVVRRQSDNANLSAINLSRGALDSAFSPSMLSYTVNVGNEVSSLSVMPVLAQADATLTINNQAVSSKLFTLPVGTTPVTIKVTAQNGVASKTYSLSLNRAPSSNARLQSLNLSSGGLSPLFDPNTHSYNAVVGNEISSVTVTAAPQENTAAMVLEGNVLAAGSASAPIDLFVGSPRPIVVEVSAEDGTLGSYTINVTRQQSAVANLSSLVPSVGSLSPVFSQTTTSYVLNVINSVSSVSLTPTTLDGTASVQVNGVTVVPGSISPPIAVAVGNGNYVNVRVTAQNGSTAMDYTVNVVREGSSNADLADLQVNSGFLSPAFDATQTSYSMALANNVDMLSLTPTVADVNAKVKINGVAVGSGASHSLPILVGQNSIDVEVQAQNGTLKTYHLAVNRLRSNNAELASLTLSAGNLQPLFDRLTTSYNVTLANSISSLTLTPTVADSTASIKVNNIAVNSGAPFTQLNLPVGSSLFTVQITAQDGTLKTYSINVNRAASSNNNLASLFVLGASVTPSFAANTLNYSGVVANDVSSIQLLATLADANASLTLNGLPLNSGQTSAPLNLNVGPNDLVLEVTAQDGMSKIYTVSITRQQSDVANLAALLPSVGTLSPAFSATTTAYTVNVSNATSSITLTPTLQDLTASVTVNGVAVVSGQASQALSLNVGSNYITVRVTAQNGSTTMDYVVNAQREGSSNADLAALTMSSGTLSPAFSASVTAYSATVANTVSTLTMTPQLADSNASLTINGVAAVAGQPFNQGLVVGSNTITLQVTAQNGAKKSYVLTVIRQQSNNADLAALSLSSGSLSPAFSAGVTSYSATVANDIVNLTLRPTVAQAQATVTVNGVAVVSGQASQAIPLSVGLNIFAVTVQAEDGVTSKIYTVSVTRALSSNALLANLTVSNGTLDFVPSTSYYNLSVDNAVSSIAITATVQDAKATLAVNNAPATSGQAVNINNLVVGSNIIPIVVTAEDGSTLSYQLNITRLVNTNADLVALGVSAGTLSPAFDRNTAFYTVEVTYSVTSIRFTPQAADAANAVIELGGAVIASGATSVPQTLLVGNNDFTIFVTAADGSTTNWYQVQVIRAGNNNANLSNLTTSAGNLVFDGGTSYNITVLNSVSSITVTPTLQDSNAHAVVGGEPLLSGQTSSPIALAVGTNAAIEVWVTAENGTTQKIYSITVTREAQSANADLSALSSSLGALDQPFSASTLAYTQTVVNSYANLSITATTVDSAATLSINGQAVISGFAHSVNLTVGSNVFNVVVTAQNGTQKIYTLTVTRQQSSNADLNGLSSSLGALDQAFSASTLAYTQTVANGFTSLGITATTADSVATLSINGQAVTSGFAHNANLTVGSNLFNVVVTAQNGVQKTYTLTVTRQGGTNANLSALVSNVALNAVFDPAVLSYSGTADNNTTSVAINATVADAGAMLKINNQAATSGVSSQVSLLVGVNSIPVQVTAADGATVKTYTLNITRSAASTDASLQWLTISSGTLTPAFSSGTLSYSANVANSVSSINVAAAPNATVTSLKLNGSPMVVANQTPVGLTVGQNLLTVTVVAQDGTTSLSYQITVTRAAPGAVVDATVCSSGCTYSSVQAAIDGMAAGSVIEVQAGSYSGVLNFGSKALTLISAAGAAQTTLTANTGWPVVTFTGTVGAVLDGFTIDNSWGSASGSRGVVVTGNSQVTISNSIIKGNTIVGFNDGTYIGGGLLFQDNTATSVLHNVTITGNGAKYGGGGLGLNNASVRLTGKINIDGNSVNQGGGGGIAAINGSHLEIDASGVGDSSINSNYASGGGSGIYFDGSSTGTFSLKGISVNNNTNPRAGYGGGVHLRNVAGTASLSNCTINGNIEKFAGGGLYATNAMVDMQNCEVKGNALNQGSGGGIWLDTAGSRIRDSIISGNSVTSESGHGAGVYLAGAAELDGVIISGNTGYNDGGGLYSNSDLVMSNSLVSGNVTTFGGCCGRDGGGIALFGAAVRQLSHVTVVGNRSYDFGGFYINDGTTTIENSIIWGNSAHQGTADWTDNQLNNLGSVTLNNSIIQDGWSGAGSGNLSVMPSFVDYQVAVGTAATAAGDFRLCVDAVTPDARCGSGSYPSAGIDMAPAGDLPQAQDLLGNARPSDLLGVGNDGNNVYDAGAYEYFSGADNFTVFQAMTANRTDASSIVISASYLGDANGNNSVSVDYKLTADSQWTNWVNGDVPGTSPYQSTITGLQAGQSYDVRVSFSDADGVNGTNPQIVAQVAGDARLSGLSLGAASFTPGFDPALTSYSTVLASDVSLLQVTAVTADPAATLTIAGQPAYSGVVTEITLQAGDNVIPLVVTAVDGNTRQYTINVYRVSSNADLSSLLLSTGSYTPSFDPAVTSYSQSIPLMMNSSVTVTPTAAGTVTSITVNGNTVLSGQTSQAFPLVLGSNTISVVVQPQSGASKTYNVFITTY